ncbi:Programmed cell death protein 2 [Acipenser ruthenus]|uniref:Programmed cell death protein 2 n=1 Tax=Acipenser ruthenus TaxID=7906 RepID=A0A444V3J0_ACIRT|nr:Programmed cell death protein 2 [Acipenser ruthenus]
MVIVEPVSTKAVQVTPSTETMPWQSSSTVVLLTTITEGSCSTVSGFLCGVHFPPVKRTPGHFPMLSEGCWCLQHSDSLDTQLADGKAVHISSTRGADHQIELGMKCIPVHFPSELLPIPLRMQSQGLMAYCPLLPVRPAVPILPVGAFPTALQVYAPIPRQARSFHRTCFVFCCKNTACYSHNDSRCFKVYRSQLPRKNDFYSYDPPVEEEAADIHSTDSEILQLGSGVKLCRVCGCLGPKSCSRCHSANYCSREHQTVDWKAGHKKECSKNGVVGVSLLDHKFLFLEYEVVTEPEDLQLEADSDGQIEEEQLKESEPPASDVLESMDEKDLEAMAKHESKESKVFEKFKRRTAIEPEQVLRYCRMGRPLWVSDENVPKETDIPNCLCGAKRLFEFQTPMRQLTRQAETLSAGTVSDAVQYLPDGAGELPRWWSTSSVE